MKKLLFINILIWSYACSQSNREDVKAPISDLPVATTETVNGDMEEGDSLELKGKLICAHCHALNEENLGIDHQMPESGFAENCANLCAQQGYPIAVLVEDAVAGVEVWVIRTSSQLFEEYMASNTKIKGTFVTPGIIEPH